MQASDGVEIETILDSLKKKLTVLFPHRQARSTDMQNRITLAEVLRSSILMNSSNPGNIVCTRSAEGYFIGLDASVPPVHGLHCACRF